jgi:hypothetical protein
MYGNLARKGLGNFKTEWYWSSTPYNFSIWMLKGTHVCARAENFSNGVQSGNDDNFWRYSRDIKYRVRAIRQF